MCEYENIMCISKMESYYLEMFNKMVEEYSPKLSDRIILSDSIFTLHDFEHHCFDIYKIISYVLFDENLVYQPNYGLTQRELFLLNLSVLFHDIGMSQVLNVDRENHSLKSAEYIQSEYDMGKALRTKTNLTKNEIKALKAIIIAHSDVKDGTVSIQENGLNSPKLINYQSKDGTHIRTKFLAGVLRMADELDVSSERLGSGELERQIEECKEKYEKIKKSTNINNGKQKLLQLEKQLESLEHWKKLHLITSIQRNNDGETIELYLDDEYIERKIDDGNTYKSLTRNIVDIYLSIEKRLNEAIKLSFNGNKFSKYVSVKRLQIITNIQKLENEIQCSLAIKTLSVDNYSSKIEFHNKQTKFNINSETKTFNKISKNKNYVCGTNPIIKINVNEDKISEIVNIMLSAGVSSIANFLNIKLPVKPIEYCICDNLKTYKNYLNINNQIVLSCEFDGIICGRIIIMVEKYYLSYIYNQIEFNYSINLRKFNNTMKDSFIQEFGNIFFSSSVTFLSYLLELEKKYFKITKYTNDIDFDIFSENIYMFKLSSNKSNILKSYLLLDSNSLNLISTCVDIHRFMNF